MTENEGSAKAPRDPSGPDSARPSAAIRWALVVAPAAALLIGLGLGALLVSVGGDGSSGSGDGASPSASATAAASPGDVTVVVPQECQEAAETVQQATTLIRDSVATLRDFNTGDIRSLLNQLEDLDAQAREQAAACTQVDVATVSPTSNGATESPSE